MVGGKETIPYDFAKLKHASSSWIDSVEDLLVRYSENQAVATFLEVAWGSQADIFCF